MWNILKQAALRAKFCAQVEGFDSQEHSAVSMEQIAAQVEAAMKELRSAIVTIPPGVTATTVSKKRRAQLETYHSELEMTRSTLPKVSLSGVLLGREYAATGLELDPKNTDAARELGRGFVEAAQKRDKTPEETLGEFDRQVNWIRLPSRQRTLVCREAFLCARHGSRLEALLGRRYYCAALWTEPHNPDMATESVCWAMKAEQLRKGATLDSVKQAGVGAFLFAARVAPDALEKSRERMSGTLLTAVREESERLLASTAAGRELDSYREKLAARKKNLDAAQAEPTAVEKQESADLLAGLRREHAGALRGLQRVLQDAALQALRVRGGRPAIPVAHNGLAG
jgi:hypothetical protein